MIQSALSAAQLFRLEFGTGSCSRNFMTPRRLRLLLVSRCVAVELSTGRFLNDQLYGVTTVCLRPDGTTRRGRHSSQCFHSKHQAERHIARIASILKGGADG